MHIRRVSRERWLELAISLDYFDGRCEAMAVNNDRAGSLIRAYDLRCRNPANKERDGWAVCWRHHVAQELRFIDPRVREFRGRLDERFVDQTVKRS